LVWKIEFQATAIKQLQKMGHSESARVRDFLHSRVKTLGNPRQLGVALQGSRFEHLWRYKVGDYRIICDIQDQRLVVLVIEIGHRREVYR
jgi:mRNA interferase RelE/StbE